MKIHVVILGRFISLPFLRKEMQQNRSFPILYFIKQFYDLTLWYLHHIEKFPRSHRFTLGDRLESCLLDILETMSETAYTRNRRSLLEKANRRLHGLRLLTRLATDLKCLAPKQQEYAAKQIEAIGRQLGGWIKTQREGNAEDAEASS